ncbi:MAG: hypothetical protein WDM90_00165 [Ferruginibacter sp.]
MINDPEQQFGSQRTYYQAIRDEQAKSGSSYEKPRVQYGILMGQKLLQDQLINEKISLNVVSLLQEIPLR